MKLFCVLKTMAALMDMMKWLPLYNLFTAETFYKVMTIAEDADPQLKHDVMRIIPRLFTVFRSYLFEHKMQAYEAFLVTARRLNG